MTFSVNPHVYFLIYYAAHLYEKEAVMSNSLMPNTGRHRLRCVRCVRCLRLTSVNQSIDLTSSPTITDPVV